MANTKKVEFAREVEQAATIFAQACAKIEQLRTVYMDRGMYDNGENPLTEADILETKNDPTSRAVRASVTDIVGFVNFAGDLKTFLAGGEIKAPQAWSPTVNKLRTDM